MTAPFDTLIACAGMTTAIHLSGFSVAYHLQTETFHDILSGINFLALGAYAHVSGGDACASNPRKLANLVVFFTLNALGF